LIKDLKGSAVAMKVFSILQTAGAAIGILIAGSFTNPEGGRAFAQAGLTALTVQSPGTVIKFFAVPGGVLLQAGRGRVCRVAVSGDRVELQPDTGAPLPRAQLLAAMIPNGGIAQGSRNIRRAWLVSPTHRYPHGALGDKIEAGGVRAILSSGVSVEYRLDAASVFEDLTPRLIDLDADGKDEIAVVRSYLGRGSALAVFSAEETGMRLFAESRPIGATNRWLNPVGAGNFDGDGEVELAAVVTPHIGGVLTVYKYSRRSLRPIYSRFGFSNHAMGSRELGMSAITDADGVVDIVLPDASRRNVKAMTVRGGRFGELAIARHTTEVKTNMVAVDLDGRPGEEVVYGLEDNTVVVLRFRR
jgi:hypothetical protein